jgi:hypothetical protein
MDPQVPYMQCKVAMVDVLGVRVDVEEFGVEGYSQS